MLHGRTYIRTYTMKLCASVQYIIHTKCMDILYKRIISTMRFIQYGSIQRTIILYCSIYIVCGDKWVDTNLETLSKMYTVLIT